MIPTINLEANAIGTLFTNNLEIDENVEAKADSGPTTFVLNIIELCLQQPIFQQIQVLLHLYSTLQKRKGFQQPNILVASISSFAHSTTKLQQLIKKVNTYIDFKNT